MSSLLAIPLLFSLLVSAADVLDVPPGNISWVNCTTNVPQPLQDILNITDWTDPSLPPLPASLKCGRVNVPMDYTQPISENNTITLGLAYHTVENSKGVIFFNPGGPGDEAVSWGWDRALNRTQVFEGLEDFDFMMMDPRGIWSSNAYNCSADALNDIPIEYPTTQADFDAYQNSVKAYAQSCIDLSTPPGIIGHLGTEETVEDWETIRKALGYDKVNLYGVSYGTYYYAEYSYRHPEAMGNVVLDAVLAHGQSDIDQVINDVKAMNRLLLRADAYCIYNSTCPFHEQGKGSVVAAFEQVLQIATAGNLTNPTTSNSTVSARFVRNSVNGFLRGTPSYDVVFQALEDGLVGNGTLFDQQLALDVARNAVALPIFCLDQGVENDTFAGFEAFRTSSAPYDPTNSMTSIMWQGKLTCSGWPFPGRPKQTLPSDLPILWFTADYDLNTASEGTTFAWEQAPNSVLVVRHGDDHGTLEFLGTPARDLMIQYLTTGALPQPTNQTLVSVYTTGTPRDAIADPYTAPIGEAAGDDASW